MDPSVLGARGRDPSLRKIAVTCFSTAASLTNSVCAMPTVRLALGHRGEHGVFAGLSACSGRPGRVARASADHLGVERAAAGRDARDGVQERLDVADAFLEQVADPLGALADELEREGGLAELREDEHAGLGQAPTQLDGGDQAVVLAPGRHPDVDDRHVGAVRERPAQQVVGVAGLRDDVKPGAGEDARDALAHQDVVLPDRDAHRRGTGGQSCSSLLDEPPQRGTGQLVLREKAAAPARRAAGAFVRSESEEISTTRAGRQRAQLLREREPVPVGQPDVDERRVGPQLERSATASSTLPAHRPPHGPSPSAP